MDSLLCFGVLAIFFIRFGTCVNEEYMLPSYYSVEQYDIKLSVKKEVFDGSSLEFTGSVIIDFRLIETKESTSLTSIQLHAPFTKFASISVYSGADPKTNLLKNYTLDTDTSILTINTNNILTFKPTYSIKIDYTGQLETVDMHGFYRSSYIHADKTTKYLVATQFEPVYARQAFPCFDEPKYKAKYTFSITYPQTYTAFFNTPQKADSPKENDNVYETATFETTPKMSTYLVAFSVSDFDCSTTESADKKLEYKVCSRKATAADRKLASEYGPKILDALGTLTNINFDEHNIGKMDQLAIPDLSSGAMENYGLVTYREACLLWNENESSNRHRQNIITIIAHEFSHMWFGDLVTLNWWDNTFLNEGFARYFQYFTIVQFDELNKDEKWDMARQFVVETQQSAFLADSSDKSSALASSAITPLQISNKFDTISYSKGASILRMLNNVIEDTSFFKGIQSYLSLFSYQNSQPTDLWTAIEHATSIAEHLPKDTTLEQVMNNWINKAGYPVVKVSAKDKDVTVTQKRFLYDGEDDTTWYVPISYTVSNDVTKFQTVTPDEWLLPNTDLELKDVLKDSKWIILNNQESSYYRVNYDSTLWEAIRTALVDDLSKIDVLNRAQIVDDLFNLAKAGEVNYADTFDVMQYLEKETDYYPWYSAVNGFNTLLTAFASDSKVTDALKTLQLNLLKEVVASVAKNADDTDQIYTFKRVLILQQACFLGEETCVSTAKELFTCAKNGTSFNKNLKPVAYCNGLRYSSSVNDDWSFLWSKFEESSVATEQITILAALGCTNDKALLTKYLQESIKANSLIRVQDLSTVWNSVVKSSQEGVDVALDFFIKNYKTILTNSPGASTFISTIAAAITSDAQEKKLKDFGQSDLPDSLKTAVETALTTIQDNMKWTANIKGTFDEYFELGTTVASTTDSGASDNVAVFSSTILLVIFVIYFTN